MTSLLWPIEVRKRLWGVEDSEHKKESTNDKAEPQTLIITTAISKIEDKLGKVVQGQEILTDTVQGHEILMAEIAKNQEIVKGQEILRPTWFRVTKC